MVISLIVDVKHDYIPVPTEPDNVVIKVPNASSSSYYQDVLEQARKYAIDRAEFGFVYNFPFLFRKFINTSVTNRSSNLDSANLR